MNVKTRTVCVTVFAVKKGVFDFDKGLGVEGGVITCLVLVCSIRSSNGAVCIGGGDCGAINGVCETVGTSTLTFWASTFLFDSVVSAKFTRGGGLLLVGSAAFGTIFQYWDGKF